MKLIDDVKSVHKTYSMIFTAALAGFEMFREHLDSLPPDMQEPVRYSLIVLIFIGRVVKQS